MGGGVEICPCVERTSRIPHSAPAGNAAREERRPAPYPTHLSSAGVRTGGVDARRDRDSVVVRELLRSASPELVVPSERGPPLERVLFPPPEAAPPPTRSSVPPSPAELAERDYARTRGGLEGATRPFPNHGPDELPLHARLRSSYLHREAALLDELREFSTQLEQGYLTLTDRFALLVLQVGRRLEHDDREALLRTLRTAATTHRSALVHAIGVNQRVNRLEGSVPTLRRALSRARSRLARSRDTRVELSAWLGSATDRLQSLGFVPDFEEGPNGRFLTWREVHR